MSQRSDAAGTGIETLDSALGGLYWGDNVVFDVADVAEVEPFYRAVSSQAPLYDRRAFVTVERDPDEVVAAYDGVEIIDARPGSPLDGPRPLLDAIARHSSAPGRHLLLFDAMDALSRRFGPETTARFFARCCPMLLGLGAVAYWALTAPGRAPGLRREIEGITQCVLVVAEGSLRIAKAEGRPPGVEGSVFRLRSGEDGVPELEQASTAGRLGSALRALRISRRLSQADVARLAGVSASAISQAERGSRGLSLETLLELTSKLDMTIDELLRGEVASGYRLARRDDPRQADRDRPVPLLDDPQTGLLVYVVRLSPGGTAVPHFPHKGREVVAVANGLIQVELATGRPVLRQGEALLADRSGVSGWRNLTEREATAFWILHDV